MVGYYSAERGGDVLRCLALVDSLLVLGKVWGKES